MKLALATWGIRRRKEKIVFSTRVPWRSFTKDTNTILALMAKVQIL